MGVRTLRRLAIAVLFVVVATAAWLAPHRPLASGALLGLAFAAAFAVWWVRRDERRAIGAALRCDLDALERCAARGGARAFATFALVHHGGFARARTSLCTCGTCEDDVMSEELARTARVVRAAYEGRGESAYELARESDVNASDVPPLLASHVSQMRLVTRLVAYAAAVDDDASPAELPTEWVDLVVKLADTSWLLVRWPVRLAAARHAAARGEPARARALARGMPSWPEGSPLERVRRRLVDG